MKLGSQSFTASPPEDDLCERTLALFRYFGSGSRTRFLSQVAARAVPADCPPPTQKDWWRIFNRLQDFGLIAIQDLPSNPRWVWIGECLYQRKPNHFVCPPTAIGCSWFSELSDVEFERETLFELRIAHGMSFRLDFLSFTYDYGSISSLGDSDGNPVVKQLRSFVEFLPSAREILMRTASLVDSPLIDSSFEHRTALDKTWKTIEEDTPPSSSLLRKLRVDRAGYQYWIYVSSSECYEIMPSDWIPLLQWYALSSQWPLVYNRQSQTLAIPNLIFFRLPVMIRQALVTLTLSWPSQESVEGTRYMVVAGISLSDARHLEARYSPALRIEYV